MENKILLGEIRRNAMRYKNIFATVLVLSVLTLNSAIAGSNFKYTEPEPVVPQIPVNNNSQVMTYNNNQPLRGSVLTVPSGATFPATLTSGISSADATVGQNVYMILGKDFYYGDKLVAPAGSSVIGNVIEVVHAKHGSLNGKLTIRFTQIVTTSGTQIPISAVIKTDDGSGVLVGGTKTDVAKEYTKDVAIGTAAGALSGVVFGALAGGSIGRAAALGTAVGAGGGLVKSAIDKGNDVVIPANATVELYLTQPITVTSSHYSFEN